MFSSHFLQILVWRLQGGRIKPLNPLAPLGYQDLVTLTIDLFVSLVYHRLPGIDIALQCGGAS